MFREDCPATLNEVLIISYHQFSIHLTAPPRTVNCTSVAARPSVIHFFAIVDRRTTTAT